MRIAELLHAGTTSSWLRAALRTNLCRDPVDAANDARLLSEVLDNRVDAMLLRAEREADLCAGMLGNQFVLLYQPQVDEFDRLTGVEALVRWQHPRLGLLAPARFIPLAEETGQIVPLGYWALQTACQQLKIWSTQPHTAHLTMAVNVSALQFCNELFVPDVVAILELTGAPATRLKLELTESLLVRDVENVVSKMLTLKALGIGFSLDDFGTGYSSLNYLKRLPLDQIKIDQSFLHDPQPHSRDAAIIRAIVALGQTLNLTVIAEGVETQEQRDFLEAAGCNNFQGYFFGHPAPVGVIVLSVQIDTVGQIISI